MDAYVGEIRLFPFNFCPVDWLPCDGRALQVTNNQVLYSIIGTFYGGNGTTTFNLPLLVNYSALGAGQGKGLAPYNVGQVNGIGAVNLITSQIPSHTHQIQAGNVASSATASTNAPLNALLARAVAVSGTSDLTTNLYSTTTDNTTLAPNTLGVPVGATGSAHDNHQPYLALQYCICTTGIYPTQG